MALNPITFIEFDGFATDLCNGLHNLGADVFKVKMVTSIPAPTDSTTPATAGYTESTGNGYTAGGEAITASPVSSGGQRKWVFSAPLWNTQTPGFTAKAIILWNATADRHIAYADITEDAGVTPIDSADGDVSFSWGADGILTVGTV